MRRFIGSALFFLASAGWASAALGPLEAAAILAEAKAANAKCAFLSPAEADNLGLYAARAEVAAVGAASPEEAGPPLQKAQARGRATACDADAKARVREIYSAANEAMIAVNHEAAGTGPVSILPKPKAAAPAQAAPRPVPRQVQVPQPPAAQPVPAPAPAPVPVQPRIIYNFTAQQPAIQPPPVPQPQYVYAEPAPEPVPQYVYAQPAPEPVPQYVYAEPAPEPVPQYVYAQPAPEPVPQYVYAAPQPQVVVNERFLARFSVVLERPELVPVVYQAPAAVYAPVANVAGGLDHYAIRASAYYVETRCQHLNQQQAQQFWQSIASEHAAVLERENPAAIEAALAQARAQADQMACSALSAQFVQQAFQGL